VFAFVSLDEDDKGDHLRAVRQYADAGFLTAGYKIWRPDFEQENFTLAELAEVANQLAKAEGVESKISDKDIRARMNQRGEAAGTALVFLMKTAGVSLAKGKKWGEALADFALSEDRDVPEKIQDETGQRPAVTVLLELRRGQRSDYQLSKVSLKVGPEGKLIDRPR
jgi:hypothetical protein